MKKHFVLFALLCITFLGVNAQTKRYTIDNEIPSYLEINDNRAYSILKKGENNAHRLKSLLNLNENTSLSRTDTLTDIGGGFHESYKEYYKNIEVEGSRCIVHFNNKGKAILINGNFRTINNFDIRTSIRNEEAENIAFNATNDLKQKIILSNNYDEALTSFYCRQVKLVIYIKDEVVYVVYKVIVSSMTPELNKCYYIDANTGDIIDVFSSLCNINTTVSTTYSGSQAIETDFYSNSYRLRDYSRGNGILTLNNAGGSDYTSSDNTWNNMSDYDRAALDAHWGVEKTYDFYLNKFNRNSYDNNGAQLISYVNLLEENAYWTGTYMLFGRISGNPLVCLDVTAHELTHAVTGCTSNLSYYNESGALNEGISDAFAACIEKDVKPQNGNKIWQIGEDAYLIRDMSNPTCKYYQGLNWVNTVTNPNQYNDYGGVHTNSGVFNYWFYLLVNGGSGTNQAGYSYSVTGVGFETAIQICYLVNTSYLLPNSTFPDIKICTYYAAQQLGYGTNVTNQIIEAWYAVGVYGTNNIIGSTTLYDSAIYSISDLPNSFNVTWSLSGSNSSCYIVQNNTPSTNQCTITKKDGVDFVNANNLVLQAQVYHGSTLLTTLTKPLTAVYIYGPTVPCGSYTYQVKNLPSGCTVSWQWSGTGIELDTTPVLVEPFYSTNNYFGVIRSNLGYASGTITANILQNGDTIASITKIINTAPNYSGTWYQGTATAATLQCGQAYPISYGSQVVLQSSDFVGKTVTYTKNGLRLWGNNISHSGNTISFTPLTPVLNPDNIESIDNPNFAHSITIKVTDSSTCEGYEFTFYVELLPIQNNIRLDVGASGSEYTFSLEPDTDDANGASEKSGQTWTLEIVKSETGQTVYSGLGNKPQTVNVSGWKAGIYIAVARCGENSYTQKLVIGE